MLRYALPLRSLVMLLVATAGSLAAADDWPQWRGPTRDDVWREAGIVDKFDSEQLDIRWRQPIGSGYSGPTVAEGRVFVTDRLVEPQQVERVHAFDAISGEKLWTYSYDCPYVGISYQAGPRACVTIDDGRAFALGTMGHLNCLDAATGKVLWNKELSTQYDIQMPIWGISAAPLVVADLLIIEVAASDDGACLVAFDKNSGDERWRALSDRAQYSAPILIEQAGKQVVVCWTGDSVAGLDAQTGKLYWRYAFPPKNMPIGIATPITDSKKLFVTSFYDGSLMLALDQNRPAVQKLWQRSGPSERKTEALHSIISTPLLLGDYIYGVDSYGELRCLDASSGQRIWEDLTATPTDRWSNIHFVVNGQQVWMFNERGELIISRLSPRGFDEISRAKLLEPTVEQLSRRGGVCWAHPAFANRHVFARNDNEIVCASLESRQ